MDTTLVLIQNDLGMWFQMLGGTFLHVECATNTCFPSPDRLSLNGRGRAVVDTCGCDVYLATAVLALVLVRVRNLNLG